MMVLDYLPVVFHEWLAQPERILFVAELEGKIVGTEFIFVVDEGKTATGGAWRIHRKPILYVCLIGFLWYRGVERNISKCMG